MNPSLQPNSSDGFKFKAKVQKCETFGPILGGTGKQVKGNWGIVGDWGIIDGPNLGDNW